MLNNKNDSRFGGFSQASIDYLWDLRFYNDKTWFDAHKDGFRDLVDGPLRALAATVVLELSAECKQYGLESHISRIYRDARRLHGQGPLKDHLWFSLRKPCEYEPIKPVLWFEIEPEGATWGMGYYQAPPLTMAKHRARIEKKPAQLAKLARRLAKQEEFVLDGDYYHRPKGAADPPLDVWYNLKNFSLLHKQAAGDELFSPRLAGRLVEGYRFLMPFYAYFISLENDPEPGVCEGES